MMTNFFSTTDSTTRSRLYVIAVRTGVTALALVVLYLATWAGTAMLLLHHTNDWIDSQRQDGLHIQHGEPVFHGFPGRITLTFLEINISSPAGWTWAAPTARVSTWPMVLNRLSIDLSGVHTLSAPLLTASAVTIENGRAEIDLHLGANGEVTNIDLTVSETAATSEIDGDLIFSMDSGRIHLRPRITKAYSHILTVETFGLHLPIAPPAPFTPIVQKMAFTAETSGAALSGSLVAALDAWRISGGAVEVHTFEIVWPPFTAAIAGTAALDDHLQPVGAFSARLTGFFEVVDALVADGTIENKDASMAKIVLGLLARTPPGGGPSELSISITAQEQRLYAGPVMLMQLPTVTWPDKNNVR